jgi:hypothetical protein
MANNTKTLNEKDWQIEADAYTLIESEKIKLDPKRLSKAQKKAKEGWTKRKDMPVIETEDVKKLQARLEKVFGREGHPYVC